jgi:hypothetical protein
MQNITFQVVEEDQASTEEVVETLAEQDLPDETPANEADYCMICYEKYDLPVTQPCCQKKFCFLCLKGAYDFNNNCPHCCQTNILKLDHLVEDSIEQFISSQLDKPVWLYASASKDGYWLYGSRIAPLLETAFQKYMATHPTSSSEDSGEDSEENPGEKDDSVELPDQDAVNSEAEVEPALDSITFQITGKWYRVNFKEMTQRNGNRHRAVRRVILQPKHIGDDGLNIKGVQGLFIKEKKE